MKLKIFNNEDISLACLPLILKTLLFKILKNLFKRISVIKFEFIDK